MHARLRDIARDLRASLKPREADIGEESLKRKRDAAEEDARLQKPVEPIHYSQTRMCFDHANGFCKRAEKCSFEHNGWIEFVDLISAHRLFQGPPGLLSRLCHRCKQKGHIARDCPERGKLFDNGVIGQ